MDIVSALAVLSLYPVEIRTEHLVYSGCYHPLIVPCASLNPSQRQDLLLHGSSSDREAAIIIAIRAQDEDLAWTLLNRFSLTYMPSTDLDFHLKAWSAKQLSAFNLPAIGSRIRIITSHKKEVALSKMLSAETSVKEMLSSLIWPLWSGPLLIHSGETDSIKVRPILPSITLKPEHWNDVDAGAALCELALQRYRQGGAEWPAWLILGLREVAKNKIDGTGPSPKRMLGIRKQAGIQAMRQLISQKNQAPNPELAKAICAVLVHTRNKHKLASFLALISNNVNPETALFIAYERDLESLISEP